MSDELHSFLITYNSLRSFSLQPITQGFLDGERLCDPSLSDRQGWMSHQFILYYRTSFKHNSWSLWEDLSPWSSLLSLSIDSTVLVDFTGLLRAMSGHTSLLEDLKIAFDPKTSYIEVFEQFLSSFNTLKSLECIGCCSLRSLSSHIRLVNLKMHAEEILVSQDEWREPIKPNVEDLEQLSVGCPDLRWLELDAQLEAGDLVRTC